MSTNIRLNSESVHLVGEFTVRVASEQRRADLRQQLLRYELQPRLQRVANLRHKQHS